MICVRIAVIIPAFNVAPFLGQTLGSLLRQTHADWTAVVVDDGSVDASAEVAAAFVDSRIRVLRQINAGVSAARNSGLRVVFGMDLKDRPAEAVMFLDGDDWLAPDALSALAHALSRSPEAVAVSGCFARADANGAIFPAPLPPQGDLLERLLTQNLFANGGHVLIRGAAAEAVGGFRTDLIYGEDWEYWTRLALSGPFASVAATAPVLFVRERTGSAYRSMGTNPSVYQSARDAIYRNTSFAARLGPARLARLSHQEAAERAWAIGREMIRHGRMLEGQGWLAHSLRLMPRMKRLLMIGLSWLRVGPFRPYPSARSQEVSLVSPV